MKLSETGRKSCDKLFSEGCEINSSDGNGAWRAEREQRPESRFGYEKVQPVLKKKREKKKKKKSKKAAGAGVEKRRSSEM